MTDVFHDVTVAPADVDFLAGDRISAIALVFGLCGQRAHVGPRLRLRQVHRAVPFPGNQLWQKPFFQVIRCVMLKRFDLALAHHRDQLQRQTRAAHHFIDGCGQSDWQAHTAVFRARVHTHPTAVGNGRVGFFVARRGAHYPVFKPGWCDVPGLVHRCQNLGTHFAGLAQNGLRYIRRCFLKHWRCPNGVKTDHMVQQKFKIIDRCTVGHFNLFLRCSRCSGRLALPVRPGTDRLERNFCQSVTAE